MGATQDKFLLRWHSHPSSPFCGLGRQHSISDYVSALTALVPTSDRDHWSLTPFLEAAREAFLLARF